MAEELGYLIYPGDKSKLEDSLFRAISAACDRLGASKDTTDQCVGIALTQISGQWAEMVKQKRSHENEVDRLADEQQ